MNCANRYEVQRRIVGLKNLLKSGRTTLDHDPMLAADTAVSTPTRKSRQAERLYDSQSASRLFSAAIVRLGA
jgi:hypothetical protein